MSNDIDGWYVLDVIGRCDGKWENITEWEYLSLAEAEDIFERVSNDPASFICVNGYDEIEIRIWDDENGGDAVSVCNVML